MVDNKQGFLWKTVGLASLIIGASYFLPACSSKGESPQIYKSPIQKQVQKTLDNNLIGSYRDIPSNIDTKEYTNSLSRSVLSDKFFIVSPKEHLMFALRNPGADVKTNEECKKGKKETLDLITKIKENDPNAFVIQDAVDKWALDDTTMTHIKFIYSHYCQN